LSAQYAFGVTSEPKDNGRHRGAGVLATVFTYATALFLCYSATFVLFLNSPFRPNGPYRGRICEQPHLVFGQICRDWTMPGMTSGSRVGWGAVFLGGFLLLAFLARRFVWVFLLVPLATLPYINTERRTWIVMTIVSVGATAVIGGLRLLVSPNSLQQARFLPVTLLTIGTACAAILSALTSGPVDATLTAVPGLITFSAFTQGIACTSAATCVVVGTGNSQPVALTVHGSTWEAPTSVRGASSLRNVACASSGNCIADDFNARIAVEHDGRWKTDSHGPNNLLSPTAACSPHALCWATYQRIVNTGPDTSHQLSEAIGEIDGRLLPAHLVGPVLTARESAHKWGVYVSGISCWSATSCTLTGSMYAGVKAGFRPFVQSESRGVWGSVSFMPSGLGGSTKDHFGTFPLDTPITCTAGGNCLIGGFEGRGAQLIYGAAVEREVDGRWLPTTIGTGSQLGGQYSQVVQVACHTSALCVASGGGNSHGQGWLTFRAEVNGQWRTARIVPIKGEFSAIGSTHAAAAACPTLSSCYVVGWWLTSASNYFNRLAFVASYTHGKWGFNLYALGRGESETELLGLGCDSAECWAIGTAFYGNTLTGFAYPLVHLPVDPRRRDT